jgi:hypothetical protein
MLDYGRPAVSTAGTVPGLGAYPDGDPEAIRHAAAELRRVAGALSGVPRPRLGGWRSSAATAARGIIDAAASAADDGAGQLRGCASSLERAADTLDADQSAWLRAKQRLEDAERAEAARKAAAHHGEA